MSDEVSNFLRSVEQLKDRRDSEDEARSRELEQKILQERRERQARREERARSISPQKSSPANTPPRSSHRHLESKTSEDLNRASSPIISGTADPELPANPTSEGHDGRLNEKVISNDDDNTEHSEHNDSGTMESTSPTKENESPFGSGSSLKRSSVTSPSAALPSSRASPLSWQRRRTSQGSDRPRSRSRPLSMVAAENAAARSNTNAPDANEPPASRDSIVHTLSSKDPSWFRQTADRAQNSAAYRRSQIEDEDGSETTSLASIRAQLPGMGHDPPPEPARETMNPRPDSTVLGKLASSPMPLTREQRFEPPAEQPSQDDLSHRGSPRNSHRDSHRDSQPLMSPPAGRTSPGRPVSPTKGMGGFVQSAMMKRTDSVKRWSVNSPPGLQRADSVASNRNSMDTLHRGTAPHSSSHYRSGSTNREGNSRPTSSHSRPVSSHGKDLASGPAAEDKPAVEEKPEAEEREKATPPSSPSKTMDPRRWSPNKSSSWLDAALNKPESPKQKSAPAPSNQPSWMVELNKAKAQRANNNNNSINSNFGSESGGPAAPRKHEVKTGGLLRSSPMGSNVKPTGLGGGFSSGPSSPAPVTSPRPPTTPGPYSDASKDDPETGDDVAEAEFENAQTKSSASGSQTNNARPQTPTTTKDFRTNLKPRQAPVGGSESEAAKGPSNLRANLKSRPPPPSNSEGAKDFRANLKPRQPASTGKDDSSGEQTNEFKNVFGNLRRARTQNYVAPDELKDNILRGKAGLAQSGGPQKTEQKDELKESILAKKGEFQKAKEEGRGVTKTSGSISEKEIPEGLAKSLKLGSHSQKNSTASEVHVESSTKAAESERSSASSLPRTNSAELKSPSASSETEPPSPLPSLQKASGAPGRIQNKFGGGGLADRFNPGLAGILARGPPMASGAAKASESSNHQDLESAGADGASKPGPQLTHMTKSRARGPRRKAPMSAAKSSEQDNKPVSAIEAPPKPVLSPSSEERPVSQSSRPFSPAEKVASPEPQLVSPVDRPRRSITEQKPSLEQRPMSAGRSSMASSSQKSIDEGPSSRPSSRGNAVSPVDSSMGRARPSSPRKSIHEQVAAFAALSQPSAPGPTEEKKDRPRSLSRPASAHNVPSPVEPSRPGSPKKPIHEQIAAIAARGQQPSQKPAEEKPEERPLSGSQAFSPTESSQPREGLPRTRTRGKSIHEQVAAIAARNQPTASKPNEEKTEEPTSQPASPRKLDMKRMSRFMDESNQKPEAERTRSPSPQKMSAKPLPEPPTSLSPRRQSANADDQPAPIVPVKNGAALFGGALSTTKPLPPPLDTVTNAAQRPRTPMAKGASRPLPAPPSPESPVLKSPPAIGTPMRSPTKYASEVSNLINDFFGDARPKRNYNVDSAELLMKKPQPDLNLQTQKCQLFQFSGDGKKMPVPTHYERVLFEREMYLCPHTFVSGSGKKNLDVYFWAGDEVPRATVDDATVFAQREAKALGGKLVKLTQGKETSEFLQALGGTVIIRRGSSNKYDSLAPNMLCGRRYLGQVVFDEVDFFPSSLCSGFPYLIAFQGKCYLWKGKGSNVDELSCARLVGMDLALMGELVEVEDGEEPQTFWNIFDGGAKPSSADHWRLKPNYDKYCARLFCSDVARREQIYEIHPFSEADLSPNSIYVLDAFFEMYIVVGHGAESQYVAFHNALDFAQEYAILSASMEDRPFMPVSTVVLEGIPRDLKSVFRKWRDEESPTRMNPANQVTPNLKRGRSLRIMPLNQALQALTE